MASPLQQIYQIDQVPDHFKEPFLVTGYRNPRSTVLQCCASVFYATNETFNFWTHFVPACFFCYKMYMFLCVYDLGDAYCLPMLTYMISLCLFPFTSAVAHMFNTMSDQARHICFFLDYWALSQYSVGAAVAYRAYIFPDVLLGGGFHRVYLYVAIVCGMVSLSVSCQSRFMEHGLKKRVLRIGAYAIPYLYTSIPSFYRLYRCFGAPDADCQAPALVPHSWQFLYVGLAALLYLSHWPERSYPGRFDIVGHSHQLFHLFSIYAAYLQLAGLDYDFHDRKDYLYLHNDYLSSAWSVSLFVLLGSINVVILLHFVCKLSYAKPVSDRSCNSKINANSCHEVDEVQPLPPWYYSSHNGDVDVNVHSSTIKKKIFPIGKMLSGCCDVNLSPSRKSTLVNGVNKRN